MRTPDSALQLITRSRRLVLQWTVIADPARDVAAVAAMEHAALEHGERVATRWMQRARAYATGRELTLTPVGHTPQYMGRTCCYIHLARYDGRIDIGPGLQSTCAECGRVFELRLGAG